MNICIFGDSITWGPRLPFRVAWANLLRNHLEKNSDNLYSVYDLGVDGNSSKDVIERFDVEAAARKPELIIFNVGTNDSLFRGSEDYPETSLFEFKKNMEILISKARQYTGKIIIVGLVLGDESLTTPLIQSTTRKSYTKKRIKIYNDKLREISSSSGIAFVDINSKLNDDDFDDGLHPNINGHIKIFHEVSRVIDGLLLIKHDRYAVLVDKNDSEIGVKKLEEIEDRDVVRVAGLWITNDNGMILLSKRPVTKRRDPNRWSPSVACIVEKGMSYMSAIKIAAKNEIGLEDINPKEDSKLFICGDNNFYCQMFSMQLNLDINNLKINKNETQELKWFSRKELLSLLKKSPFLFVQSFDKYFEIYQKHAKQLL